MDMKKVIGFFGGDGQTGTTTIAWSFAEKLTEKGKRVLLILGSGNDDPTIVSKETSHSIDELKAALRSGRVEREDLFQCLEKRKQLWILPGTRNSLTSGYFLENTFQILLKEAGDDFDYVIIDGGADLRLGLTVSALNTCSLRYFVVTQQAKTLHRYMQSKRNLLSLLNLDGKVIVNQYRRDPVLFLKKDVCRLLDIEDVILIPYVAEGWQAEMERKNLLYVPRFAKAIETMLRSSVQKKKKEGRWKKVFR